MLVTTHIAERLVLIAPHLLARLRRWLQRVARMWLMIASTAWRGRHPVTLSYTPYLASM